jgi:hypothetical protein
MELMPGSPNGHERQPGAGENLPEDPEEGAERTAPAGHRTTAAPPSFKFMKKKTQPAAAPAASVPVSPERAADDRQSVAASLGVQTPGEATSPDGLLRAQEQAMRPRREEGRVVASQNATSHGLFSEKALISGESPEEFEAFRQYQLSQLQVRGGVENLIAEHFVMTSWRLQRLERIEAEAFTRYGLSSKGEVMGPGFAMIASVQGDNFLSTLGRYEAGLRRQYFRCLDTLHALRKGNLFDYLPPPVLLDVETVPPAPVVGPAPGQGQRRPVAVPSGVALDKPTAARSAGHDHAEAPHRPGDESAS